MPVLKPHFTITPAIAQTLMRIEAAREAVSHLPITASVLASLRETARLFSTHYSTMIEGNRLTAEQVSKVLEHAGHFPGRERDEREVLGCYAALEEVERHAAAGARVTESMIQSLHARVMSGGAGRVKPTPYRDGQNVIRDAASGRIVYMPPEAREVPILMAELVGWLEDAQTQGLPCPIRASIAHYQFATIHPYYDGNGRTARLLTTLILHLGGYDLKGIYSLEEYYARKLSGYYDAIAVGPSHNYYDGRAGSDITEWIDYFCRGVAESFESVRNRAREAAAEGAGDDSRALRGLDPRQRKALELFRRSDAITSCDVERLFAISQRAARNLLTAWTKRGFLIVLDQARKTRKYGLAEAFRGLAE
jgi:Fic family protein